MLEHVNKVSELGAWQGEIPVSHLYTAGVAGERFFREIKENGRLMGAHCSECSFTFVPPTLFCQRCFRKLEEWREAGPAGTVRSRTLVHFDLDGRRLEKPEAVGLIQLDGADGLLAHRLAEGVKAEQRVKPVFREPAERSGSITDILEFRAV